VTSAAYYKRRSSIVFGVLKLQCAFVGLICATLLSTPDRASAVTVEVAKKCIALTDAAYPPRIPGNPAAGSAKGTGRSEQDYFSKCVARGGKMDDKSAK
jgi:hypothetical protein